MIVVRVHLDTNEDPESSITEQLNFVAALGKLLKEYGFAHRSDLPHKDGGIETVYVRVYTGH